MFSFRIRKYLSWLKPTSPLNAMEFQTSWEKKFGNVHDPDPSEIVSRLSFLSTNDGGIDNSFSVAEIGAGYGRVAKQLTQAGFQVFLIEPNEVLFQSLKNDFPEERLSKIPAGKLPRLPVQAYFSCRALEYCSLFELTLMLVKLRRFDRPLLCWERPGAVRRLNVASILARNPRVYTQTLIR